VPLSVRASPEDAVELVIEQREGVGRAEDPDQHGTDQALDELVGRITALVGLS